MKKILIIHTSSGYGHLKIAENIAAVLSSQNQVELLNIFEVENGKLTTWGTGVYLWILNAIPGLWNFFYTNQTFIRLTLPFRVKVAAKNAERIKNILDKGQYDVVISTQVSASAVISYLKTTGGFTGKFVVTFSDFHLHPFWLYNNVDLYLANIEEQKQEMLKLGIPENKILVAGITVPPIPQFDSSAMRQKYFVDPGQKVILILGGGRGLGIDYETVSEALGLGAKVIVVCGKNQRLQSELERRTAGSGASILGFIENMSELYAIADIVVSKPGGLTIAECLQRKIPILVSAYLPGQEKLNYEFLVENGLVMPDAITVRGSLEDELSTGSFKKELENNPRIVEIAQNGAAILSVI